MNLSKILPKTNTLSNLLQCFWKWSNSLSKAWIFNWRWWGWQR